MILEADTLLKFDYDVATDTLSVCYPDFVGIPVSQIENSLQNLSRIIANYDVKKLLLDLRSGIPGVEEKDYRELVKKFLVALTNSRIEKIARVIPENPAREYMIENYSQEMRNALHLTFAAQSFTSKTEALEWLQYPKALV